MADYNWSPSYTHFLLRSGLFHTARLLGHRWHGPASESVLQEAVRPASRPTEGQLQPYDCSCAGDAQLFFVAWCNSKLARCSIGEGALRPLCDVCRRCGRWVPHRSLTSSPSFCFLYLLFLLLPFFSPLACCLPLSSSFSSLYLLSLFLFLILL